MRWQGRKLHVPPNSEPGRSGLVFSRKQFGRRIPRCTSAPVTQNHFRQILSLDIATITLRRPAWLANHFAAPEKARERSDRATIIVAVSSTSAGPLAPASELATAATSVGPGAFT